jgi:hypothetical protein
LLSDLLQVATGEDKHLDEPLVLDGQSAEPGHREYRIDRDLAVIAGHLRHHHRPAAIRAIAADGMHITHVQIMRSRLE